MVIGENAKPVIFQLTSVRKKHLTNMRRHDGDRKFATDEQCDEAIEYLADDELLE